MSKTRQMEWENTSQPKDLGHKKIPNIYGRSKMVGTTGIEPVTSCV